MFIEDDGHRRLSNDGILEYLKANRDRTTFRPSYYCGDTIIEIQVEENADGAPKKCEWPVEH